MIWYLHALDKIEAVQDPDRLVRLREQKFLIEHFRELWFLLHQGKYFSVCLKEWPYSANDCMVIYSWAECKQSIDQLNSGELWELWDILWQFQSQLIPSIGLQDIDWVFGINYSQNPGPGQIQSVDRLHFQFSWHDLIQWTQNHVKTEVIKSIDRANTVHQQLFSIRESSKDLFKIFLYHLWNSENLNYTDAGIDSIDFSLEDSQDIFSEKNKTLFQRVHGLAKNFLSTQIWVSGRNLWFSLSVKVQANSENTLRLRFFAKSEWDHAGSMETQGHTIKRTIPESGKPQLPDMTNFVNWVHTLKLGSLTEI